MSDYVDNVAASLDRQILFNMPLRKAVALFSILLFVIIALSSSVAYYFAMQKILNENLAQELKQTLNSKQLLLRAELEKETLLLKVISERPIIRDYFLESENEVAKANGLAEFELHRGYFQNKMISWISTHDSVYYVNGQAKEKYVVSNQEHAWFFENLTNKNPPLIKVAYDYLNRQIYDLYVDYPAYSEGKVIGVVAGRISLFEFISRLDLPDNVLIFGKNGVIIGASNAEIAKKEKTLQELFDVKGEYVHKKAIDMVGNSVETFRLDGSQFVLASEDNLGLFLVAKDQFEAKKILEETASIIFFALLLLLLVVIIIFNKFISKILRPMNKNMTSYIESSLLTNLQNCPTKGSTICE